jgi:hypothetical protein
VPAHDQELLNVTIRHVLPDTDTVMRYADQEMLAVVMFFHLPLTEGADQRMPAMT